MALLFIARSSRTRRSTRTPAPRAPLLTAASSTVAGVRLGVGGLRFGFVKLVRPPPRVSGLGGRGFRSHRRAARPWLAPRKLAAELRVSRVGKYGVGSRGSEASKESSHLNIGGLVLLDLARPLPELEQTRAGRAGPPWLAPRKL
eukprot:2908257-Rhodomonas_salina.1